MAGDRHVAVAEYTLGGRVSVFGIDGAFIRHVGVGVLKWPTGVACSAFDELVAADFDNARVCVFNASGELVTTMGDGRFSGVAISGDAIFCQRASESCVVFR
jgi:hypothetical protein